MYSGSFVALVTPFDKDGRINYLKIAELIDFHKNNGTDGIVLLGTTGEAGGHHVTRLVEGLLRYITKEGLIKGLQRLPVVGKHVPCRCLTFENSQVVVAVD